MPATIFDDINSTNLASYWLTLEQEQAPYLWDTLFPTTKQTSSDFSFYRGIANTPKPLMPSAFDAQAIMRGRQGYGKVSDHTRYFKEGKYIDEQLRQELLRVGQNATPAERDMINTHIFADTAELLSAATLTREIMRNQLVQSGKVNLFGNGQLIQADYQMKPTHLATAAKAWGADGATPFDDIKKARQTVEDDSGQTITRAVMNATTLDSLLHDANVKSTMLYDNGSLANVTIPQSHLLEFLVENYNLTVQVYDKSYMDIDGTKKKWIPDGRVIFLPDGSLGQTVMSTTPEEADLLASAAADVSIVDQGVAITTTLTSDPVSKKTNVSQQVMPTFEQIDGVYVLDTVPKA